MSVGTIFGMILFVAVLAFLFGPSLLEIADDIGKRISARKKAGGTRSTPGL